MADLNPRFHREIRGFLLIFPLNQSIDEKMAMLIAKGSIHFTVGQIQVFQF